MFGQCKLPCKDVTESQDDFKNEATIINVLDSKNKSIKQDFEKLKKKFLDIAEQKMDQIKEDNTLEDNILEEMENIRKIYVVFKEQNSNLKHLNEVLNNKHDAKTKLNEHLEEKCANIMIEKEDIIIKLRAEIISLKNGE